MRRRTIRLVLVALLACVCVLDVGAFSMPSPAHAVSITRLHTEGKDLTNDAGQIVYLRGAAVADLSWRTSFQGDITARIENLVALTEGKITAIRCAITWLPTYPVPRDVFDTPEVFDAAVDELMRACVANDLYFWTNFHGTDDPARIRELVADPRRLIDFHVHFVDRYADVPNFVGIEVWNEPWWPDGSQAELRGINERVYEAVHAADPTALVIVSGFGFWRIEPDYVARPLGPQAVYSWDSYFHDWAYDWYQLPYVAGDPVLGWTRMEANLIDDKRIDADLPVLNSELGWLPSDPPQAIRDYYTLMNAHGTHHVTWRDVGTLDNYGLTTYTSPPALTSYGQIWAQYLTGHPRPPPPTTPGARFGYPTLGGSVRGVDKIEGSTFTCPEPGTATSITVGVRSPSRSALRLRCAIYRHRDLRLVAVTEEATIPGLYAGWTTLAFPEPAPTLASDTAYLLVAFSESRDGTFLGVFYDVDAASPGFQQGYGATFPSFPEVLSPSSTSRRYSIYCTYTPAAPPTARLPSPSLCSYKTLRWL
jgi:hypothetical protein